MKDDENKAELIFETLLKTAATEALKQEMEALPSPAELDLLYKPSPKLDKKIKKIIFHYELKEKILRLGKRYGKVAACIAFILTITTTVLLSVDASRNYIFNTLLNWFDDHTSIEISDEKITDDEFNVIRPGYIPEGFLETQLIKTDNILELEYENADGSIISIKQYLSETINILVDNEKNDFSKIEINGNTAYLFKSMDTDKSNILIFGGVTE